MTNNMHCRLLCTHFSNWLRSVVQNWKVYKAFVSGKLASEVLLNNFFFRHFITMISCKIWAEVVQSCCWCRCILQSYMKGTYPDPFNPEGWIDHQWKCLWLSTSLLPRRWREIKVPGNGLLSSISCLSKRKKEHNFNIFVFSSCGSLKSHLYTFPVSAFSRMERNISENWFSFNDQKFIFPQRREVLFTFSPFSSHIMSCMSWYRMIAKLFN